MIKTFIIAALSADGFIAHTSNELSTSWTSKGDKDFFVEKTKQAGVVVMGSKTFETFGKALKDRKNIIYSRNTSKTYEGAEVTHEDPHTLLARLEQEGFTEVAICGGSSIYSLFMEAGVVDTLYLTIEPILFGKGVSLFEEEYATKLELVNYTKIDTNTIQCEYKVIH